MTNQSSHHNIAYRRMTEADLPSAYGLTQAANWAHRLEDWQLLYRVGCGFVAHENGAMVGSGLCWKFGTMHAALGMIVVSPQRQGKGIGRELMNLILAELGARCTMLTATPAGQPLYEKLGFVPIGMVIQHQGTMQRTTPLTLAPGERLRPVVASDLPEMVTLLQRALGMPRDDVMAQVLDVADGVLLEKDGKALGFSIVRRFGRGHMIGPVVAPDTERAKALIAHWSHAHADCFVRVDVTGDSGLSDWVDSLGLVTGEPGVRMVRGQAPVPDGTVKQYAILSQATG